MYVYKPGITLKKDWFYPFVFETTVFVLLLTIPHIIFFLIGHYFVVLYSWPYFLRKARSVECSKTFFQMSGHYLQINHNVNSMS